MRAAGATAGRMTRVTVCRRVAPSSEAASSTSAGSSSSTGCTVRMTKGSPMKVSASTTPAGAKATWSPSGARKRPTQPLGA